MKLSIKSICLCALFSIIIAIGAFIRIPISIIPITLQTLCVLLTALILGGKLATISVLLYIFTGLIGLPVFSNGGGIGYVLQPSFGYLLGFILCAYVVGTLAHKSTNLYYTCFVCFLGSLLIYVCGLSYFVAIQYFYFGKTFSFAWIITYLFLIYLPGDIMSGIIASVLKRRIPVSIDK